MDNLNKLSLVHHLRPARLPAAVGGPCEAIEVTVLLGDAEFHRVRDSTLGRELLDQGGACPALALTGSECRAPAMPDSGVNEVPSRCGSCGGRVCCLGRNSGTAHGRRFEGADPPVRSRADHPPWSRESALRQGDRPRLCEPGQRLCGRRTPLWAGLSHDPNPLPSILHFGAEATEQLTAPPSAVSLDLLSNFLYISLRPVMDELGGDGTQDDRLTAAGASVDQDVRGLGVEVDGHHFVAALKADQQGRLRDAFDQSPDTGIGEHHLGRRTLALAGQDERLSAFAGPGERDALQGEFCVIASMTALSLKPRATGRSTRITASSSLKFFGMWR